MFGGCSEKSLGGAFYFPCLLGWWMVWLIDAWIFGFCETAGNVVEWAGRLLEGVRRVSEVGSVFPLAHRGVFVFVAL